MVASTTNTAALNSLVSVANSKIEPKLLTDTNYEILSIKPSRSATSGHNTVAEIRIDLAAGAPVAVVASDRYSRRTVEFTRIDLKEIAKFRGLEQNEKGQYIGTVTDAASAIALLDAAIEENEIKVIKAGNATIVKAVETSLGYIGTITFAGAAEEAPEETPEVNEPEEPKPPVLTELTIAGESSLNPGATSKYTVAGTPADAPLGTVVWSAERGLIDEEGTYIAPEEAGPDTITVTSGSVTATHSVNIVEPT